MSGHAACLTLPESDQRLLELLRTEGLSIKNLKDETRADLAKFLFHLYHEKGLSLSDIARLIGNKTSGYTSWLCKFLGLPVRPFEEARLKAIREKRRKYERRPFDGTDEDKAYLLGLRHGDLSVSRPWKGVVRVSTSTTHPAMAELFHSLFGPYGHVYQHPRFKMDTKSYEWNLSSILDPSFEFLFQRFSLVRDWLVSGESLLLSYLSGLLDADGSIVTTRDNRGYVALFVDYYNSDKAFLTWIKSNMERLGYRCSLRINKKKGVRTKKYGIVHRKNYWQLSILGMANIQRLVRRLQPRHREKIRRKKIALAVARGQRYSMVEREIVALRAGIKVDVKAFVKRAETEYVTKHSARDP